MGSLRKCEDIEPGDFGLPDIFAGTQSVKNVASHCA